MNFKIKLIFLWLKSPDEAKERVKLRVKNGGHYISDDVIERRYFSGLRNLLNLYIPFCDFWLIVNNERMPPELICEGIFDIRKVIYNHDIWNLIKEYSNETGK